MALTDDIAVENRLALARIERRIDGIARLLDRLCAQQHAVGPQDAVVLEELLPAIATEIGPGAWTVGELRAEAGRRPALKCALKAVGLTNSQLAKLLSRCEGAAIDGLRLERAQKTRTGIRRRVVSV